ncbi:glycosyltransferase [Pseudalkalibacillus berkeleyi]|uniref:Glycosyltransferase n=1 Tax=Pseudalkalibacillus berkeleyi TaxID=1069813 RepID=A0ABS9GVP8_9BACL|nr:glycosyltransferase [Pseudalkalibacillus berkeleyi]MCF6136887.1 glycosyltransferase [Pseudalkalibacillus berkeleyi]
MMWRKSPKVSIVIPFYNCMYIDRAIESALAQTYPNCEIIVVDDGSTMYVDRITPYKKKIKYIRKVNGGTATALNKGIQLAEGEYFSWLSSDDLYHPQKVEKQLQYMIDHQAFISYGNYYLMNEYDQITSNPTGVGALDKRHFLRLMRSGCIINGCTIMAKIEILKKAGLFDETLPFTHDYDLWLRLSPAYDFLFFDQPLVNYRIHGNMGSQKYKGAIAVEVQMVKRKHRDTISRMINSLAPVRRSRYLRNQNRQ